MSEIKFFISGKVTGLDKAVYKYNFQLIEDKLRQAGAIIIYNPVKRIGDDVKWRDALDICLDEIADCDVIVFQQNWTNSIGAKWEFMKANQLHKEIRIDREGDYRDIRGMIEGKFVKRNAGSDYAGYMIKTTF